jgi:hypothetical protein
MRNRERALEVVSMVSTDACTGAIMKSVLRVIPVWMEERLHIGKWIAASSLLKEKSEAAEAQGMPVSMSILGDTCACVYCVIFQRTVIAYPL